MGAVYELNSSTMERKMFYGAQPDLFEKAKKLRKKMTLPELILWNKLRESQLGVRFKPQHPIDIFIADFYCHSLKLIIEVDGGIHEIKKEYDEGRTNELKEHGINVIRFSNDDVLNNIDIVLRNIKSIIEEMKAKLDD
jgi:very-short-patch-repair endonuclease